MKKSLHKTIWRTLLVLVCVLTANSAWADVTIYVNSSESFNLHYWGQDVEGTAWPGVSNSDLTSESIGGVTWYKITFEGANSVSCILNDAGGQTEDILNLTGTKHLRYNGGASYYILENTVWTVAGVTGTTADGASDSFFTHAWNANDNVMSTIDYSNYTWTSAPVTIENPSVAFKVVINGNDWIPSGNDNNVTCSASGSGTYLLNVTYKLGESAPEGNLVKLLAHNTTNFPDDNFRNYLSNTFSTQTADGYWTLDELASVTSINCSNQNITTLKGIENFTALTELNCSSNKLTSIDLTSNTALTNANLNGQSVTFNNIVKSLTYENRIYYFIWLNNQYNGQDPWFVGAIQQLDGMGAQSQFDLNRVTWGEGCQEFTGTAQNNTSNSIGLQALSDGLPADIIAGKVLLVSGNADEGTFKYNYAATGASKDGSSMEVTVNWTGASVPTGIDTIGAGEIKATRYYNLMGVESATPFHGVNIVVKEYSDGTRDTSRVIMK